MRVRVPVSRVVLVVVAGAGRCSCVVCWQCIMLRVRISMLSSHNIFPSSLFYYYCTVYLIGFVWMVVALTLTRNRMRKQYQIPGSCCGDSPLDDCCCAFWCQCCVVLQMHRHTHDEKAYGYNITSKTGLDEGAPEIV